MSGTCTERKSRADALDRLLMEAGSVAANWRSAVHRAHGHQEARSIFLPGPEQIGRGKFKAALALREALSALAYLRDATAREQTAAALRALVNALRAEPSCPPDSVPVATTRNYWVDRE
jgi:hypothetical protein